MRACLVWGPVANLRDVGLPVTIRAVVLQALEKKPGFGTDIVSRIEDITGEKVGPSSVYAALRQMLHDGVISPVSAKAAPQDRGGRPPWNVRLTVKGLKEWDRNRSIFQRLAEGTGDD